MKKILICFAILVISSLASAQISVKLKIEGVEKNGGKIYISIFNSETTYKVRDAYLTFTLDSKNEIVIKDLTLPTGQYVFSIYQDGNDNQKLDTNLIGIPKEKFGFTNYDGKSAPGGFNRHKVQMNEKINEVVVRLYKI
jgi:uncharacterized protein (DUF2141 family)